MRRMLAIAGTFGVMGISSPALAQTFMLPPSVWSRSEVENLATDLDSYWRNWVADQGGSYRPPTLKIEQEKWMDMNCGRIDVAIWCPDRNEIHVNVVGLDRVTQQYNESSALYVVMRTYAKAAQASLRWNRGSSTPRSLQQDCLTGRSWSDVRQYNYFFNFRSLTYTDPSKTFWDFQFGEERIFGTPTQRLNAFQQGRNQRRCTF